MAEEMKIMRLVRPIYDAIDNRQYKNAIKLCNQKKVCDIDLVQVLQAHCLERIGKVDEALRIVRRVQLNKPTDDTMLSTMQLVFKLCGVAHEMIPSYEHAASVQPQNEELQTQLFFAYARALSLAKQQQLAFKMYKTFNKLRYIGWYCMSMLLQVTVDKSLPMKMLPLADKMLAKALREHPNDANGEIVQLLVLLLQAQGKHQEAMEAYTEFIHVAEDAPAQESKPRALEGEGVPDDEVDLGPMQAIDRIVLEATLAKDIGDWQRCANVYTTLLTKFNGDDWAFWLGLIEATSKLESPEANKELWSTIKNLQTEHGSRFRGPHLAEIELQFRTLKSPDEVNKVFVPLLLAYMERFASKTCCFSDLQRYLLLDAKPLKTLTDACKENLKQALAATKPKSGDLAEQTLWFRKSLLARKMLRFLGDHKTKSTKDLLALVDEYLLEYDTMQWLNQAKVGGQREVQVTDDLLLLAVHLLLDTYSLSSTPEVAWLLKAAGALELGLQRSAYNFQMKMLLCRVYAMLGAGDAMLVRYKELDIKQIQLDSLSYLVLDALYAFNMNDEASRVLDSIRALHKTTARDTPEFIARAYRLGVYSKAEDMTSFLVGKMQRSEMLALATAESCHSHLLKSCSSSTYFQGHIGNAALQAELDALLKHQLSPNHHREVEVDWTLPQEKSAAYVFDDAHVSSCDRTRDPKQLEAWLKLRAVVPRMLSSFLESSEISSQVDEFEGLVHTIAMAPMTQAWNLCTEMARALGSVAKGDLAAAKNALLDVQTIVQASDVLVLQAVDGLMSAKSISTAAIYLRDIVPYSMMFLSVMLKHVKPKKKAKDPMQKDVAELLRQIVLKLTHVLQAGAKALRQVHPSIECTSVADEVKEMVKTKVEGSQKSTIERLEKTIADHIVFLRSI